MARPNLAVVRRATNESRELWLRVLGESTSDLVVVLDAAGAVTFASEAAAALIGVWPGGLEGAKLSDRVHPDDKESLESALQSWMDPNAEPAVAELRLSDAEGDWIPTEATGNDLRANEHVRGVVVMVRDVSHREASSWSLDESSARIVRAARSTSDGLWDWDLTTQHVHYSEKWREVVGVEPDDVTGKPEDWLDRIHPEDRQPFESLLAAHLDGHTEALDHEHRVRTSEGKYRWILVRGLALRNEDGVPTRIAGSMLDVSERKLFDALTRLPNRGTFKDVLETTVERWTDEPERLFAVMVIDLDRFKVINDSLGHHVGDRLLTSIARRIQSCVRPHDTVARLGGDEFAVLLDGIDVPEDAERIAHEIKDLLGRPLTVGSTEVYSTASLGIALSSKGYIKAGDMLRDADTAMHRAKDAGRDRAETFQTNMHIETLNHFKMEVDLRRAIRREEFVVHYQPLVDLHSGRLNGFEALVRWQSPERGFVSPMDFIPLAEEVGLIAPIDRFVLKAAASQARDWQQGHDRLGDLAICVNVSSKQFSRDDLVEYVASVLEECELDPRCLKLEITESAIMQSPERAADILYDLRDLGVRLALDDFGTGYSSLGHLHRFPFDVLKIDRSFVSRLGVKDEPARDQGRGSRNPEIVSTIVALANALSLDVVAEGIETAEHLELLRAMGCRYGQGWFFSKPLTVEDAERVMDADPTW
ncbi:MAG: EAL domain-containing protein [Proteobacteria bacterium]|nr:EAL domain-containing protein [Pseudomonadota bacterium]